MTKLQIIKTVINRNSKPVRIAKRGNTLSISTWWAPVLNMKKFKRDLMVTGLVKKIYQEVNIHYTIVTKIDMK